MLDKEAPNKAYDAWMDDGAGAAYAGDDDVKTGFTEGFCAGEAAGLIAGHYNRRGMRLPDISRINRARTARWHAGGEPWHASDWGNALAGETGELCNMIKKVRRHETGVAKADGGNGSYNTPDMDTLRDAIKNEIADVFLYLDLVANHFGLELEDCIFPKFNAVSEVQGFPERLPPIIVAEDIMFLPGSPEAAEFLGTNHWTDDQGNVHWINRD